MSANFGQHIVLKGDNPMKAIIAGTNLKAYRIAQFVLAWGAEEAVQKYGVDQAQIYSVLSFYYDNIAAIEVHELSSKDWQGDEV
jgi:ribose/xylose/arabinose/galactoside ABC-type transport system permease subunit